MNATIRAYLNTLIVNDTSFDASSVYKGRYQPTNLDQLPIVSIRFTESERDRASMGENREFFVTASWDIAVLAKPSAGVTIDEVLDTYTAQVKSAVSSDRTLGGNVHDCFVTSIGYTANETGEEAVGEATVSLQIEYSET